MIATKAFSVLLIDDDPHMHRIFRFIAVNSEFTLCSAISAEEAVRRLDTFTPDVVVIDLYLENVDGFRTLQILRENKFNPNCRYVATTAYHTPHTPIRAIEHGFDAYLQKPLHVPTISESLRHLVS
jgi:two-component system nitrogen regulation response regulator NtrX